MNMPQVSKCDVTDCCYNTNHACHAMAINVGDNTPRCDTYTRDCMSKGGEAGAIAGVGACKVVICRFNHSLGCHAPGIVVGRGADAADCLTFQPK